LRAGDRVALAAGHALAWAEAEQLLGDLVAALAADGPLGGRVCRAGATVALVQAALEEGRPFDAALARARAEREALSAEALAEPPSPSIDRLSRAMFRTLLKSTEPGGASALGRLGGAFASLVGTRVVRLAGAEVPWRAAAAVRPGLDADGEALLTRWMQNAVESLTFFGDAAFGLPLAAGLDLLVLSAAVALFLARAHAAAAGRAAIAVEDARRGLRQLDSGLTHRSSMPGGFARALAATASLDLLREQLG
jgi:hypothetical protein